MSAEISSLCVTKALKPQWAKQGSGEGFPAVSCHGVSLVVNGSRAGKEKLK